MQIKICGLKDEAVVQAAVKAGADYVGFVHFPASPRHITLEQAAPLKSLLPKSVQSVCVLVDPDDTLLKNIQKTLKPDFLQLHGKETPERGREIQQMGFAVIKAVKIKSGDDVAAAARYFDNADMLMFDARPPIGMLPGGNALSFDWALLQGREFPLPWFLSGGLNAANIADAIRISGATMIDVSSGVESAPGVKNAGLIEAFIKAANA